MSMIIKSKPRKNASFRQLLNYLWDDKGRGDNQDRFIITQNVRGETVSEWTSQFLQNMDMHGEVRKNGTKVLHEIISFHVKDKKRIDLEKLEDFTRHYLKLRSELGMFVAIPHLDDEHQHVHICGSPWEYGGQNSLRMSRKEFKSLKNDMQAFQKERYPELVHSLVGHEKQSAALTKNVEGFKSEMARIQKVVHEAFALAESQQDFYVQVGKVYELYLRNGQETGVLVNGKKYRFKRFGITKDILLNRELVQAKMQRDSSLGREYNTSPSKGR